MRTSFWLLLLANVILFALIQRGGLWWAEGFLAGHPNEPVTQAQPDLNAEKIRLLIGSQSVPATASPSPPLPAAPRPLPPSPQVSPNISAPVAARTNVPACLEWGDFTGADLKLATAALSALQLGNRLEKRQVDQVI
jgi:hypothetical protein